MPGHGLEESLVRFLLQRMPCLLKNQIYRTGLRIRRLLVTHKFFERQFEESGSLQFLAIGFAFVEAPVVECLRAIYYPLVGFQFPFLIWTR